MNLSDQIKSKYKDVEVKELIDPPGSIEVNFCRGSGSVLILVDQEKDRYSASYPALIRDGKGGWKTDEDFSKDMLIDGLFWILNQVYKHGKVRPEIVD